MHSATQSSGVPHAPREASRHSGDATVPSAHAHVTEARSSAPYTSAKIAMNVYPKVSERPLASPRARGPHRSMVMRMQQVHVTPWCTPRNAALATNAGQPEPSPAPLAASTITGGTRPTTLPKSATGLRPWRSARPPTSRLHAALNSANGTRNALLLP